MGTAYVSRKVYIQEVTERWVCLAVGEFLVSQREVWVPRTVIRDGWAVDYRDHTLDIEEWFVRKYRITDA